MSLQELIDLSAAKSAQVGPALLAYFTHCLQSIIAFCDSREVSLSTVDPFATPKLEEQLLQLYKNVHVMERNKAVAKPLSNVLGDFLTFLASRSATTSTALTASKLREEIAKVKDES